MLSMNDPLNNYNPKMHLCAGPLTSGLWNRRLIRPAVTNDKLLRYYCN